MLIRKNPTLLFLLVFMLKIAKYGVKGKDKILEYVSTYSDVLAKAKKVFAFPLPYYYFR